MLTSILPSFIILPLHKGSENTSALYFSWKNMNFLLYYIEIQRISSQSLFHNHKIKLLIVNVIFNCNNQLSCYRVARAIAWLQLMTTFVHLRWYAVIQNNTWSRLQHEGDKIYNSLSCSSQCQCGPPYLWIDMSLHQCTVETLCRLQPLTRKRTQCQLFSTPRS